MNARKQLVAVLSGVMVLALAGSVVLLGEIDQLREGATLEESLYIPSAKALKAMSLGYNGLMADIYWTRVVQYFGSKHKANSTQYKLLAPLLDITTELDPQLRVAYQFGATFLSQKPPEGAGDPQAAVQLIEKGIRKNPNTWQLYYELGFLQYMELHDETAAARSFERGSQIPGAHPFLRVLAASMAQHAGDRELAKMLWTTTYESSDDAMIRLNALNHLRALKVDEDIISLEQIEQDYAQRTGHSAQRMADLVQAGYLRGLPVDPLGKPYKIVDGRVEVQDPKALPFITKGLPPNEKPALIQVTPQ